MRIFLNICETEQVDFLQLLHDIPDTATGTVPSPPGHKHTSSTFSWAGYADDIVTFLKSVPGLQKALDILNTTFLRYFLKVNISKTETQILCQDNENPPRDYPESIIDLCGQAITNVPSFKYLGSKIQHDEHTTGWTEINFRIDSAKAQFAQQKNLFTNHNISIKTRTKFLNSYVRSRLTYSCQNWALTKIQFNKLDSVYATFLRKMVRNGYSRQASLDNTINYKFKFTNAALYNLCGTLPLSSFIHNSQKKYLAHLVRQPNSCFTKQLIFNNDKYHKRGNPGPTLHTQVLNMYESSPADFFTKAHQRCF